MITARLDAEAASQAKSAFLATISHEIRTPLNGVLGMAQVLAMDELTPVQRSRLEVVRKSGESLLSLLNDVLDISKIEAGKLALENITFNLDEIVTAAIQSYQSLAREKNLALVLDMGDANGVYKGDPNRIRQILYNLISNALKFTESGEIRVTCGFATQGLWMRVSDTGIGIPIEKRDLLFSKFSQVDASMTRRFGGTGLGLSICRELAELMGGCIDVQSEVGVGSTFTLTLPLPRLDAGRDPAAAEPAADDQVETFDAGLRILAAEDNPTNQLVLKTLLQFGGVDVVVVDNGALAVEAWAREAWDLILMDIQMPVMDGITAARTIRAREAELGVRRTPIIAVTANTLSHQIEDYMAAGMDAHLGKPLEAAKLFEIIASVAEAAEDALSADEALAPGRLEA